jgi:hypothetical protein
MSTIQLPILAKDTMMMELHLFNLTARLVVAVQDN